MIQFGTRPGQQQCALICHPFIIEFTLLKRKLIMNAARAGNINHRGLFVCLPVWLVALTKGA